GGRRRREGPLPVRGRGGPGPGDRQGRPGRPRPAGGAAGRVHVPRRARQPRDRRLAGAAGAPGEPVSEAVVIGRIGRPHGVRGAVRARASGRTLAEIAVGESVEVRPAGAPPRTLVLASRAGTADSPILTFDGVT